MTLNTLLTDHYNLNVHQSFFELISGYALLTEFRKDDFEESLFTQYNSGELSPDDCLKQYKQEYSLICPEVEFVILNAQDYDIDLIPVGPNFSFLEQDYLERSNKVLLENIQPYLADPKVKGLLLGFKHKIILKDLPVKFYNSVANNSPT